MEDVTISENQRKKEYLSSFIPLENEIRYLEEQIQEFSIKRVSSRTQNYDGIGRSSTTSDLSDVATEEELLLQRWMDARSKKIKKCSEIYWRIEKMINQDEKTILMMHYLQRLPFSTIADNMRFSLRTTYRIHGQALEHFELPKEEEDGAA